MKTGFRIESCSKQFRQAVARQFGQPTAGDKTIDADMILIAQSLSLGVPKVVIATSNIGHLSRFISAKLWPEITA